MPKTKDAFAFRDFDTQAWCDKIRLELVVAWCDIDMLPKARTLLVGELETVALTRQRIVRHGGRLIKYQAELARRIIVDGDAELVKAKIQRVLDLQEHYQRIAKEMVVIQRYAEEMFNETARVAQRVFMQGFSKRLRQARREAGLTQTELAKRVGVRRSSYNAFETARNEPNASVVVALSKELNTPVDWLLGV